MSKTPNLRDHRLRVMEAVLAWEGEIGNTRVRELFGIQTVQASRLLAEFRALMGDRIYEDGRAKVLKSLNPGALVADFSLDQYIHQIQAAGDAGPHVVDTRIDLTGVRPAVFATLRKAAVSGTGVLITYASMANPTYAERTIFPHALVRVGRRWHARAWCASRNEFRDFTLGRIQSAQAQPERAGHGADADAAWNKMVDMRLVPHRALSPRQQLVVRNECFAGMMGSRQKIRSCLVQYMVQDLRAAVDPLREKPPEFQIEVANAADLAAYLF